MHTSALVMQLCFPATLETNSTTALCNCQSDQGPTVFSNLTLRPRIKHWATAQAHQDVNGFA